MRSLRCLSGNAQLFAQAQYRCAKTVKRKLEENAAALEAKSREWEAKAEELELQRR